MERVKEEAAGWFRIVLYLVILPLVVGLNVYIGATTGDAVSWALAAGLVTMLLGGQVAIHD